MSEHEDQAIQEGLMLVMRYYSHESGTLNADTEQRLQAFEMKSPRKNFKIHQNTENRRQM